MKNKKNIVFMAIGAITLIAVTLGATYAYFVAQSGGTGNIDTNVITGTTDNLSFSFGDEINIYATEENFGIGMGDISDSTYGSVLLKVSNKGSEVTYNYDVTLNIESNDFLYTTDDANAEILLKVTDPNEDEVTDISGLQYVSVKNALGEELHGFDITTESGLYYIAKNYEITSDLEEEHKWNVEVILVNLDTDQQQNTEKKFDANLKIAVVE